MGVRLGEQCKWMLKKNLHCEKRNFNLSGWKFKQLSIKNVNKTQINGLFVDYKQFGGQVSQNIVKKSIFVHFPHHGFESQRGKTESTVYLYRKKLSIRDLFQQTERNSNINVVPVVVGVVIIIIVTITLVKAINIIKEVKVRIVIVRVCVVMLVKAVNIVKEVKLTIIIVRIIMLVKVIKEVILVALAIFVTFDSAVIRNNINKPLLLFA